MPTLAVPRSTLLCQEKSVKATWYLEGLLSFDQLSYNNHLFFEEFHLLSRAQRLSRIMSFPSGFQPLLTRANAFYNSVLSSEGDIFKGCHITRESFSKVLLSELLKAASKLDGLSISQVAVNILTKIEEVVEEVEKMDLRWTGFDNVIEEILRAEDHQQFA